MATRLLYLDSFDVVTCSARVVTIAHLEDGRACLTLDQTCFYPRGGGQGWDHGTIAGGSGVAVFIVDEVRLGENGDVHHYGHYQRGKLMPGDIVTGAVDGERRMINTRLHSAGHVIDMAVDALRLHDWIATKGQHYPELSAIEYAGELDADKVEETRIAIETKANELIKTGSHNTVHFMPVAEMHTVCRHVPGNIPTNKPARVVMYGDSFGIPCGGTHVKDIAEIGYISIPKLKKKKGVIRVSYNVEGIN